MCAFLWRSSHCLVDVTNRRARCGGPQFIIIGCRFSKVSFGYPPTCRHRVAAHHGVNNCYGSFQAPVSWYRASGSILVTAVPQQLSVLSLLSFFASRGRVMDLAMYLSSPFLPHRLTRCTFVLSQDDLVVSASLDQTVRVWDTTGLRKKTVRGAPSAMVSALGGSSVPLRARVVLCFFGWWTPTTK